MSLENLNEVMKHLSLDAKCIKYYSTNSSMFYDVELGRKCSIKKFSSSIKEIEFRIKSPSPLFWKIIPEKGIIQLHNVKSSLSKIDFNDTYSKISGDLPVILGLDYNDNVLSSDFASHPHTLVAGTTGSGKSNALHNIICNALIKNDVKLFLSDAKSVEFSVYDSVNKVQGISSSYKETVEMLKFLIKTMESRFKNMQRMQINSYKQSYLFDKILFVIDEISDLILQDKSNQFKNYLLQLTQKSRAAGIFVVAATQRPSIDVLSGTIKANFPARIALKTASVIDSKVIMDQPGAEILKGNGDAIINNNEHQFIRFRFPFIDPIKIIKNFNL